MDLVELDAWLLEESKMCKIMPKLSFNTLAMGASELVVHEAPETILSSGVRIS